MSVPPQHALQDGIHLDPGTRPPPQYRLLLLDALPPASTADIGRALERIWQTIADTKQGRLRDAPALEAPFAAESAGQFAGLRALVGFGRRLFDRDRHPAVAISGRPDFLSYLPGPPDGLPALPWSGPANDGEADIALQLTGEHPASVACAAVEICRVIAEEDLAVVARTSFDGFGRLDSRGWLGFHDGVSNIEAGQRLAAVACTGGPAWLTGGTTMAFLRCRVDLAAWTALQRPDQELIVGRDKAHGGALIAVDRSSGRSRPVAAPALGIHPTPQEVADRTDPPQTTDPQLEASHIHRANQNRTSPSAPASLRVLRQGYDYLAGIGPGGPALGLNFVSFQRDLRIVHELLHLPGWLGAVNFGGRPDPGPGEPAPPSLISLEAGGLYVVPPRGSPFAGASTLGR